MRPIPAPRIGESHGLLRAIDERERLRLDEFVTEFSVEDLFPPGLENALGRTRQFVSFARAAGLLKEDRGTVELTEIGKRYIRSGDEATPFAVSPGQAEWLRRQLREKHMTDSIFHGLAIGLSLLASSPGAHVSTLDFGRALAYLGRAGWDNENTLEIQGERHVAMLADIELIDGERRLTEVGAQTKADLTLPIHMSLPDIANQLNPGGPDAVRAAGEAEWSAPPAAAEPEAPAAAAAAAAPAPTRRRRRTSTRTWARAPGPPARRGPRRRRPAPGRAARRRAAAAPRAARAAGRHLGRRRAGRRHARDPRGAGAAAARARARAGGAAAPPSPTASTRSRHRRASSAPRSPRRSRLRRRRPPLPAWSVPPTPRTPRP